jgi:hypothetical protein
VLVRPSELILMSRAWMKNTADAHARECPNIKRIIKPVQPHQPLGGVGNSACHRRRADVPEHAQALHRAGALLPRRAETCTRLYAVYVGLNQWAVQRLKASGEAVDQVGANHYAELDQHCNPKSNSGRDARCCAASTSGRGRRLTMRACST